MFLPYLTVAFYVFYVDISGHIIMDRLYSLKEAKGLLGICTKTMKAVGERRKNKCGEFGYPPKCQQAP
jgi:hypothetical protein